MSSVLKITIIAFFIGLLSPPALPAADGGLMYARFVVTSLNGKIIATDLQMTPAGGEFRFDRLFTVRVTGRAVGRAGAALLTAAKHNAVAEVLRHRGLKRVASVQGRSGRRLHDEITMVYEGVVQTPITVRQHGFMADARTYRVEADIRFCPIAFPDRWSRLYLKKWLRDQAGDFISLFR